MMMLSPFRPPTGMILSQRQINRYRQRLSHGGRLSPETDLRQAFLLLMRDAGASGSLKLEDLVCTDIPRLCIVSPPCAERSLLFRLLCLRWAYGDLPNLKRVPLLLPLPQLGGAPEQAVAMAMGRAGFHASLMAVRRGLAAGQWLLLVDGWDALAQPRQEEWSKWLLQVLHCYPALAVIVAAGPGGDAAWPGLAPCEIADSPGGSLAPSATAP